MNPLPRGASRLPGAYILTTPSGRTSRPPARNLPNDARTNPAPGKAPKSGNRMSGPERRAQIIDAAIALFGRHGFKGTTTKSLARASGVSEATIFKHFPTKNDLYAAAFERRTGVGTEQLIAELQDYAERGEDERMLRMLIRAIFYGHEHDRDLHRMLLYAWLEQEPSDNQRLHEQMQSYPLFVFLQDYVRQRQAEGVFVKETTGLVLAVLIGLPVHEAIRRKLYGLDTGFSDDMAVETFARLLLDGLKVRPPR